MEFEWDENKALANSSKHGVSFDEAKTVFQDPFYCSVKFKMMDVYFGIGRGDLAPTRKSDLSR